MDLNKAMERDYTESGIIATARVTYPDVPEEVMRALFNHGYAMGSMYGFCEAKTTFETTLMEYAHGPRTATH